MPQFESLWAGGPMFAQAEQLLAEAAKWVR